MKYIIFSVNGGIGKNIMSTAVIRAIAKQHKDRSIVVLTAFPEVFIGNPDVYRVYKTGFTQYFYDEFVKNKDVIFMVDEPYSSNGYLQKDRHLTKAWCDLLNVKYDGPNPELFLNSKEINDVTSRLTKEPFIIFQPFGGANPDIPYSWNRDIPIEQAQEIVEILSPNYKILQVCNDKQPKLSGCEHLVSPNLRLLFGVIGAASGIIGIDSMVQHAAAALDNTKNTTVLWITNSPTVFGYEEHRNIGPKFGIISETTSNIALEAVLEEYDFTGKNSLTYPFETDKIFDLDVVLEKYLQES